MATSPISTVPASASDVLEREFLELRARLLQVAAHLDRIDRAAGKVVDDLRAGGVQQALATIAGPGPNRAEQVQIIFSRPYSSDWKTKMEIRER
ncbi:MAG TPA: hypothetical protein VGJ04_07105 [Pirellulales bacterium]|jgi:hypothetical protein